MRRNLPTGCSSTELIVGGCCKLCSMLQTSNSNTVLLLEIWDADSLCVCKFTYVCMYVYVPMCTSVWVYICHLCMPMCIHVCLYVCVCLSACLFMYMHLFAVSGCMIMSVWVYICVSMSDYIYAFVSLYIIMCVCVDTDIETEMATLWW